MTPSRFLTLSFALLTALTGVAVLDACGSDSSSGETIGADAGPATPATGATCSDFGGTCVKGSTRNPTPGCADGSVPVVEGSGCTGSFDVCCVPARAKGSKELKGNAALLCTDDAFASFAAGRCDDGKGGSVTCGVGCTCGVASGAATCDCTRGLPPTKAGEVECAIFGCGTVRCGVGCTCADGETGACSCK